MIYKDTITEKMGNISKYIFDNLDKDFYLAGGTALSLQIGHRSSIDLDYFINKDIDINELKNSISSIFENYKISFNYEEKNTLWVNIDGVKVSFIKRKENLLEEVIVIDSFRLAHIKDIIAMKLLAICQREEYKDYFDLACLSLKSDVRSWSNYWSLVYKNADPISFIIALSNVDNIKEVSLDIKDDFKNINIVNILKNTTLEIKKFLI